MLPRGRARASSTLLDKVYLHEFGEGTETGVAGWWETPAGRERLCGRRSSGTTHWRPSPSSPMRRPGGAGTVRAVPAHRTPASGLAAVFSFDAPALQAWRIFDAR